MVGYEYYQLLTIVQNDTKKISLEKWLVNGGQKQVVLHGQQVGSQVHFSIH